MKLTVKAAICILEPCGEGYGCPLRQACGECDCAEEKVVHTVTVHGSVWEPAPAGSEYGVQIEAVHDLPFRLEMRDLDDLQIEACTLALQYDYGRRARLTQRLPVELGALVDRLRVAVDSRALGEPADIIVKVALEQLQALMREAA